MTRCAVALLALFATGCPSDIDPRSCDRSDDANPVQLYTDGTVSGNVYRSSDWTGPLLSLPGGARFEIRHGLGEVPDFIELFLSFEPSGTTKGTLAPAAGNQAEILEVTAESIFIANGSCSDYFLLVIAGVAEP